MPFESKAWDVTRPGNPFGAANIIDGDETTLLGQNLQREAIGSSTFDIPYKTPATLNPEPFKPGKR